MSTRLEHPLGGEEDDGALEHAKHHLLLRWREEPAHHGLDLGAGEVRESAAATSVLGLPAASDYAPRAAMPIPPLLPTGLLPVGLHEATLEEVAAKFGSSNQQRRTLQQGLEHVAAAARATGMFVDLVVDGSYVTDKEAPGDIDAVLRTQNEYWSVVVPLERDPVNSWLAEPDEAKRRHGVYVLIEDAGGIMVEFYASLKPEEALERGLAPGVQRGLVRVPL